MKKIIKIFAFMAVLLPFSIVTQSYNFSMHTVPAPDYTIVEITDCPGYYSMRVDLAGPSYEDPLQTVYDPFIIVSYPYETELFEADKKFYWSPSSDHTTATVYYKEYSYSSWTNAGSLNTDSGDVTLTVGSNFLQKMSFSYDDLPNP